MLESSIRNVKVMVSRFIQAARRITVWNNGDGVPVEMHKEENVYVPELIFGHLLTSSNYNDNEKKVGPVQQHSFFLAVQPDSKEGNPLNLRACSSGHWRAQRIRRKTCQHILYRVHNRNV